KAEARLTTLLKRYEHIPEVKRGATGYVLSGVSLLVRAEKYPEALAFIQRCAGLLKDRIGARDLSLAVYDQWVESFTKKGDWPGALDIYAKALQRDPGDSQLENNALATWDAWARAFMDTADWAGAVEVYGKALAQFPRSGHVLNNLGYVVLKHVKAT